MPPIIEVDHVTKEFILGEPPSLKRTVLNGLRRLAGRPVEERPPFKALDDVSFSVQPGEVLGIIGHNGAGKSTLLKILAGISGPTRGRVAVNGRVAPLIEVGAGLVPDLTGRENIFLNAIILGMKREEVKRRFDEIVAFAELEEFIDTPVKRYSSGMRVRLGFSIATSVTAEILIVDEVLAVGDLAFQRKCFDRMEELIKRGGRTVLLVSHNIRHIERLADRVLLLDHGRNVEIGEPAAVCDVFLRQSDDRIRANRADQPAGKRAAAIDTGEVEVVDIAISDVARRSTAEIAQFSDVEVRVRLRVNQPIQAPTIGIGVQTTDLLKLATVNTEGMADISMLDCGEHEICCQVKRFPFLPGVYSLRLGITAGHAARSVFYGEELQSFQVVAPRVGAIRAANREGFVALEANWSLRSLREPAHPALERIA